MMKRTRIFSTTCSQPALATVVAALAEELKSWGGPWTLWLEGRVGAGKSTLVRALLYELGLAPEIPVLSPTYTYMNEYEIKGQWFAHFDFYRGTAASALAEAGLGTDRAYRGRLIEWPKETTLHEELAATHVIQITDGSTDFNRVYTLYRTHSPV
jgi:tRNA threonylcarbamoyl adenosine modification protein YjeE